MFPPLVATMTVLSAPMTPLNVESEGSVITPDDEIDQVPVPPVVESVHVPFGLIVSESVSDVPDPWPEAVRKLPSHGPVKSANEHEAACFVKIMRLGEPSDQVSVHTSTVLLESIWQSVFLGLPLVRNNPPGELQKAKAPPELLSVLPLFLMMVPSVPVPSGLTVTVPLSHQGASGPVAKLFMFHVPARAAIDEGGTA